MPPGCLANACCRMSIALFALLVLVPGLASAADRILKIDPRHMVGRTDMPSELSDMLEDLGYEWLPIEDPSTEQPVKVAEREGQYRMLFRATDNAAVQIDVHIRIDDNVTGLHFLVNGTEPPGDAVEEQYRRLRKRVMLEFGADNVSEGHSFMTP